MSGLCIVCGRPREECKGAPHAPMGLCCPLCGQPPRFVVGLRQAFCGTDDCPVFTWDTAETREQFLANAKTVALETIDLEGRL